MKRVACYVRVSSEEQKNHGLSVDNQEQALLDYCKANKYKIVGVYNDAGISARKTYKKRPALLRLIDDCKANKVDLIVFTKLDRWFRSVADYYEVQRVLDEYKIPWRAIWEDYETETSAGVFKVNIMLSVAQSEADRTSERIKAIQQYKIDKGEYIGGNKAPLGYIRDGKKYVINPAEEQGVRAFFNTYLATLDKIKAIQSAEDNGLKMSYYQADNILHHKAHYGALACVSEPYITLEQHELIESAKRTTKYYTNERRYIFSGLLVCKNCGNRLVVSRFERKHKDGSSRTNIRYVCKKHLKKAGCTGSSINEAFLEGYLIDSIADIVNEYNLSVKSKDVQDNTQKIKSLNARLKRLRDLYELGDINFAEYKDKRIVITNEIEALQNVYTGKIKEIPDNWLEVYNELDIEHRRAFWYNLIDRIEIDTMRCINPIIIF